MGQYNYGREMEMAGQTAAGALDPFTQMQNLKSKLALDQIDRQRNLADKKEQAEYVNPYEKMMMEQYMAENPDQDVSGIPGLEPMQGRYDTKRKSQMPFEKTEKEGKDFSQEIGKSRIVMTASGPKREKIDAHYAYRQIQAKPEEDRSENENAMVKKYEKANFGISESKIGPKTFSDRMKFRELRRAKANEVWAQKEIEKGRSEDEVMIEAEDRKPSGDEVDAVTNLTLKDYYPNFEIPEEALEDRIAAGQQTEGLGSLFGQEMAGTVEKATSQQFNVEIPQELNSAKQILEYLMKEGLNEEEAIQYIKEEFDVQ